MAASEVTLETLQKMVDGFGMDVGRVRAALADDKTPQEARALLLGGLNYVLDSWDMLPDHYQGLGVVDDALVLRVAAHLAVEKGAAHRGALQLAGEMTLVHALLGELVEPVERLCQSLPEREVRGRKASVILGDAEVRAVFEADLNRLMKRQDSRALAPGPLGAEGVVSELRKMVKSALAKAGFVAA
jgi:uncharacterized membrane protein YkvA (DUF1232 family)